MNYKKYLDVILNSLQKINLLMIVLKLKVRGILVLFRYQNQVPIGVDVINKEVLCNNIGLVFQNRSELTNDASGIWKHAS